MVNDGKLILYGSFPIHVPQIIQVTIGPWRHDDSYVSTHGDDWGSQKIIKKHPYLRSD